MLAFLLCIRQLIIWMTFFPVRNYIWYFFGVVKSILFVIFRLPFLVLLGSSMHTFFFNLVWCKGLLTQIHMASCVFPGKYYHFFSWSIWSNKKSFFKCNNILNKPKRNHNNKPQHSKPIPHTNNNIKQFVTNEITGRFLIPLITCFISHAILSHHYNSPLFFNSILQTLKTNFKQFQDQNIVDNPREVPVNGQEVRQLDLSCQIDLTRMSRRIDWGHWWCNRRFRVYSTRFNRCSTNVFETRS